MGCFPAQLLPWVHCEFAAIQYQSPALTLRMLTNSPAGVGCWPDVLNSSSSDSVVWWSVCAFTGLVVLGNHRIGTDRTDSSVQSCIFKEFFHHKIKIHCLRTAMSNTLKLLTN